MSSHLHADAKKLTISSRVASRRLKREGQSGISGSQHLGVESHSEITSSLSDSTDDDIDLVMVRESGISKLAFYLNKFILVSPVAINVLFRSIASKEFRAIAIAWSVIIPFTSDISVDEAVIPALVATSLGHDNSVVARNMYISIARSRLGLFALALLSIYFKNYHILICGFLLRMLVTFASRLLKNSIPKSEITLICGAVVNVAYHLLASPPAELYEPAALITCGLVAALPCYPLLSRFVTNYKRTKGTSNQWPLVVAIYSCYFGLAAYLYFGLYGIAPSALLGMVKANTDLLLYWLSILMVGAAVAYFLGQHIGLDGRRKLWHMAVVLMFLPGSVREREITKVCLAVAIVLFVALETARSTALPPLGVPLHRALRSFVDHRDKRGPVIISHVYLLLGIAVPIFLADSPAGVICLGIGDTFASQFGRRFGRLRVFGHKSFEGCVAFSLAAGLALKYFTSTGNVWAIVIPTAILEAVTPLNDNLVVPMYMLALQNILDGKS